MFNLADDHVVIYRVKTQDGWSRIYGPYYDREEAEFFAEKLNGDVQFAVIEWEDAD